MSIDKKKKRKEKRKENIQKYFPHSLFAAQPQANLVPVASRGAAAGFLRIGLRGPPHRNHAFLALVQSQRHDARAPRIFM